MSSLCSLLLLLHLLLFLCSPVSSIYLPPSSPRPGPRVSLDRHIQKIFIFLSLSGMIGLCIFTLCGCRVCYLKTKQGWVQYHQAATTNATSATHAWRFRCQRCLVQKQLALIPWRFTMTHLR